VHATSLTLHGLLFIFSTKSDTDLNPYAQYQQRQHHHHHHHHHTHEQIHLDNADNIDEVKTLNNEPAIIEEKSLNEDLGRSRSPSAMSTSSSTSCGDFDSNGSEFGQSANNNKLHEHLPDIIKQIAVLLKLEV
jgi:hypothetical protein